MNRRPAPRKNVLFVAYEFPPEGESGVQRSAKFVKYLPDFGYEPLVLTAAEKNAERTSDDTLLADVRGRKIFRCRGHERLLIQLPDKVRLFRRLLKFSIRPDRNLLAWVPSAQRMALKIADRYPISVLYTSVSPFSSALLGYRLKKLLGLPWVVDFRDPWTDDIVRLWFSRLHRSYERHLERMVLQAADAIVVVTPTMRDLLIRRYRELAHKVYEICNGFDPEDFPSLGATPYNSRLQIGCTGRLIEYEREMVAGKLGPLSRWWLSHIAFRESSVDLSTHSPCYLLRAVRMLLDESPELEDKIVLSFAGIFREKNMELVRELGLQNVVSVKGYLPHADSVRLLVESDVLFLPMMAPGDGRRSYAYSGKLFEYLASRRPILAAVPEGDARDLITRARAGWCVDPRDVNAIKSLLKELIQQKMAGTLVTNPDDRVIQQYDRRYLTGQLAGVFDSLTSKIPAEAASTIQ
jgi:glycosyltransferase involved in cell wall biosynthesis